MGHSAVTANLGVDGAVLDPSVLGNDGFILWQSPNFTDCAGTCVALSGAVPSVRAGKRGALNAVYELLHIAGVRFIAHDETIWPCAAETRPHGRACLPELPRFGKIVQPQPQARHRGIEDWPMLCSP